MVALRDFIPKQDTAVALVRGETYVVVQRTRPDWYTVRTPDGAEGLAPTEHLARPDLPEARQAAREMQAGGGQGSVFEGSGTVR